jgi:hypothetical protein
MSSKLSITMPREFMVRLVINGLRLDLHQVADVYCAYKWCKYTFDENTIVKLLSSDCMIVVTKFYVKGTMEVEYKCKDFVEFIKSLSEEE